MPCTHGWRFNGARCPTVQRWLALTRYVGDGQPPVDNNRLFAGSLRARQRAAAVMSLIQLARMNGHDPFAYRKDVPTRRPLHKAKCIDEFLSHRWKRTDA